MLRTAVAETMIEVSRERVEGKKVRERKRRGAKMIDEVSIDAIKRKEKNEEVFFSLF